MDDDEFAAIEQQIHDLRNQYPNSNESVQLRRRLQRYQGQPRYQARFQKALTTLIAHGFKQAGAAPSTKGRLRAPARWRWAAI